MASTAASVVNDSNSNAPIQPYRMHVSARYLDLTRRKLELARLPRELTLPDHQRWKYGTPKTTLEPLIDFWIESYDWRAQEAGFNDLLPQFRTTIKYPIDTFDFDSSPELKIHFVHKESSNPNAIPLLFCHGWPSSFTEISKIINSLTEPLDAETQAFHVVAASIPGFGFSDASPEETFGARATADIYDILMKRLGYGQYVAHGDGWGFTIARMLSLHYSTSCLALHTCSPNLPRPRLRKSPLAYAKYNIAKITGGRIPCLSFGYTPQDLKSEPDFDNAPINNAPFTQQYLQRPQTSAYSLCDSPIGLLASLVDAIHSSSNSYTWTPTDILNWTMMQWLPGPEAGLRWLKQADREVREECWNTWSSTPLGISTFRTTGEGTVAADVPPMWATGFQKVVWVKRHDKMARMPAWDAPDDLVVDMREFFSKMVEKRIFDLRRDSVVEGVIDGAATNDNAGETREGV